MKTTPHATFAQYPLLQLAIAFSAGILAATYRPISLKAFVVASSSSALIALFANLKHRQKFGGVFLLAAFCFAGAALAVVQHRTASTSPLQHFMTTHVGESLVLTGVLDGPPEFARGRLYLRVRVESVLKDGTDLMSPGLVALLAPFRTPATEEEYRSLELRYGARLRVKTVLNRTDQYRNPGVSTLTEYLDRQGFDATGVIKSPASITRLNDVSVFPPLAWLYLWRERLQREIDRSFSPETAGVLAAAILGNRYNLSRPIAERFRVSGTFHVLVISGLHISVVGGLILLIARRLTRNRLIHIASSATIVWAYTLAVGAESSVVRAALMFTFVALAALVYRAPSSLNGLGGAALVLLVCDPKEIFDPSFQLTFLSVLAIVACAWPILKSLSAIGRWRPTRESPYPPRCSRGVKVLAEVLFWRERDWAKDLARAPHTYQLFKTPVAAQLEKLHLQSIGRYLFGVIWVSFVVQIVLLPLMIIYFHRISPASLLLNIGIGVLLTALVAVALVGLVLSQLTAVMAAPFLKLANGINWLMVHSVDPFASAGVASVRVPEYSGWTYLIYGLYYLPLLILLISVLQWRPLANPSFVRRGQNYLSQFALISQLLLIAIVGLHPLSAGRADGKLRVDFLDVGQGDGALVTMPNGVTLLVDAGGRPSFLNATETEGTDAPFERDSRSIGERVVSEYLWWRGLDRVDYVLASHADADHIDGLNDTLRNFTVSSALVARTPGDDSEFTKFTESLAATGTRLEVLHAGDKLKFGPVEAVVLWPPTNPTGPSRNNDSVVLRLRLGERSLLLTGDIEQEAESALLKLADSLRVDVVKVPHHGSRTSSTEGFVAATRPQFAIISVGQTSMFGHPRPEVVERWRASGAQVLTTGKCGTISLSTEGRVWEVEKFVKECR